jgi:hypothetical protein
LGLLLALTVDAEAKGGGHGGGRGGHASARSHSKASGYVNPRSTLVRSYTTRSGRVVQSHYRTIPNRTRNDNYSTRGNVDPWTGIRGTKTPD